MASGAPRRWTALALLAVVALAVDLGRPPSEQLSARAMLGAIGVYRSAASPWVAGAGVQCRFFPSCSRYAEVAIRSHGALEGSWMVVRRLARCGPWTPPMTVDPP